MSSSANTNAAVNTECHCHHSGTGARQQQQNATNGTCDHEEQRRLWFGIIERQATTAQLPSGEELITTLRRFIGGWNDRARPLIWTSVLCEAIGAVGDFAAFQVAIEQRAVHNSEFAAEAARERPAIRRLISSIDLGEFLCRPRST